MNKEIKVGQTVYVADPYCLNDNDIKECQVIKVGRKYIKTSYNPKDNIIKETLWFDNVYSMRRYKMFLTKEEIKDQKESYRLYNKIEDSLGSLTLDQLRKINKIILEE